jgi:hypothetical protein
MSAAVQSGDTTQIKEAYFSILLPGHWKLSTKEERRGLFIYTCQDSDEQLTVSIFPARPKLEAGELEEKFTAFIRIRREAEQKGDAALVLMPTKITHVSDAITGFHQGRSGSGRLTANFAIVNSTGIANFYYEAPTLPPPQFASRVQAILSDVYFAN